MEPCTRCGATDPHRMIALMSHWFAAHASLALDGGYFYLCPACYDERIAPEYEAILTAIQEHQKPERVASREAGPGEGGAAATPAQEAAPTLPASGVAAGDAPKAPPPTGAATLPPPA